MKSFKNPLLLAAMLSGFVLAACGVDATDGSETQGVQTEQGSSAQVSSESTTGLQCIGTIKCAGPSSTSVVSVSCKWSNTTSNACSAVCPSNTVYVSGSCAVVAVDPPPPHTTSSLR